VALRSDLSSAPRRGKRLAQGDLDLRTDEVEPQRLLGDRVLDLKPRVHLEKIEIPPLVQQELDRPRSDVADGSSRFDRRPPHRLPQTRVERGARRLLQDLLVAPLNAALTLEQVHDGAEPVSENLKLDVPGLVQVALEIDAIRSERHLRDPARFGQRLGEILEPFDTRHPLASASRGGLDQERHPDLGRLAGKRSVIGRGFVRAGDHRNAGFSHPAPRRQLVAHVFDRLRRRPDPEESLLLDGARESRALREETVSRMHRLHSGGPGHFDQLRNGEVGRERGTLSE
jgi:hypothetical protein